MCTVVINCDQLSASKHIKESPQQVRGSAKVLKPILYTNKKRLHQAQLNEQLSKSTVITQSNQYISNPSPDQSALWATFERCVLQLSDKVLIEHGAELTDKHMYIYSLLSA